MAHLTKLAMREVMNANRRPLPPHVHAVESKGKQYFYFQIHRTTAEAGLRIKINDPWNEQEIANAYVLSGNKGAVPDWKDQLRRVHISATARARKGKMPFGLDMPFLVALLNKQAHRCAVSGIYFQADGYDECHMRPFAISIDRVDSTKGYTKDNVRLVCRIANFAMNEWGLPALEMLAEGISTQRRKRTSKDPSIVKLVKHKPGNASFTGDF